MSVLQVCQYHNQFRTNISQWCSGSQQWIPSEQAILSSDPRTIQALCAQRLVDLYQCALCFTNHVSFVQIVQRPVQIKSGGSASSNSCHYHDKCAKSWKRLDRVDSLWPFLIASDSPARAPSKTLQKKKNNKREDFHTAFSPKSHW